MYIVVPWEIGLGVDVENRQVMAFVPQYWSRFVWGKSQVFMFRLREGGCAISRPNYSRAAAVLAYDNKAYGNQK